MRKSIKSLILFFSSVCSDLQIPIWLHADVIALGDLDDAKAPVDPDTFVTLSKSMLPREGVREADWDYAICLQKCVLADFSMV